MSLNYDRRVTIDVAPKGGVGVSITGLRVAFDIEQTIEEKPNKSKIEIYNLTENERASLNAKYTDVSVSAGYKDNQSVIFLGQLRYCFHKHNGSDWVTTIESGDGEQAIRGNMCNINFKGATSIEALVKAITDKMGVGVGNALAELQKGDFRGGVTQLSNGFSFAGPASEAMKVIMKKIGYGYSIQDGKLQILASKSNSQKVIDLSAKTGLIGSPVKGEKDSVKITALLVPSARPGWQIKVTSEKYPQGATFIAQRVKHRGDTHAPPWYTEFEAKIPG